MDFIASSLSNIDYMEALALLLTFVVAWLFQYHLLFGAQARARASAGPLLLKLQRRQSRAASIVRRSLFMVSFGLALLTVLFFVILSQCTDQFQSTAIGLFSCLQLTSTPWYLQNAFEVRERGILRFMGRVSILEPWSGIKYCQWMGAAGRLRIQTRFELIDCGVPGMPAAEVEGVFRRFVEFRDAGHNVIHAGPERSKDHPAAAGEVLKSARLQFDLRTLLLFMLVASAGFSWLGITYRKKEQQAAVIAHFADWAPRCNQYGLYLSLDFSRSPRSLHNDDLLWLEKLPQLTSLDLSGSAIGDEGLAHLTNCLQLDRLYLSQTSISDAGLVYLEHLHHLQHVSLYGTRVTPAGKERLQRALPKCEIQ